MRIESRGGRCLRAAMAAACLFLLASAGRPALAEDIPPGTTLLHLQATVSSPVRQEILHLQLRAEAQAADAVAAQSAVNDRMSRALDMLQAAIPDDRRDGMHFATGNYSVWNETRPTLPSDKSGGKPGGKPVQTIWHAAQTLQVQGHDLPRLLKLMGELQSMGLATQSMSFSAAEAKVRAAADENMTRAVLRLREQAGKIAASLGMKVVQIRDIRVNAVGQPQPLFAMAQQRTAAGPLSFAPPVAAPGESDVSVTIEGTLLLRDAKQ